MFSIYFYALLCKKITGHKLGYTVKILVLHRMFHKPRSVELSFWNYVSIFLCGDRIARLRRRPLSEPREGFDRNATKRAEDRMRARNVCFYHQQEAIFPKLVVATTGYHFFTCMVLQADSTGLFGRSFQFRNFQNSGAFFSSFDPPGNCLLFALCGPLSS